MIKIKKFLFLFTLFFVVLFISGCDLLSSKNNIDFDTFMDDLFVDMLSSDPMNANFFVKDPAGYGIDNSQVYPITMSYDSHASSINYYKELKKYITNYDYNTLTLDQQLTYDVVIDTLNNSIAYEEFYYYESPFGSYMGYQAQLPMILTEYHFYTQEDIDNYLDYLTTTRETFESMVAFEKERASKGLATPDYILNGIIEQCTNFANSEDNYLIPIFNEKIDELTYLNNTLKEEYKAFNKTYVENDFVGAYSYLADEMEKLKGEAVNNKGLFYFEKGKQYYEALFQDATGSNMTVNQAYRYLENILAYELEELYGYFAKLTDAEKEEVFSPTLIEEMPYQDVFDFYLENYLDDFSDIGEVDVRFESINESLEANSSPAMYFISPIDANVTEVIYVNNTNFTDNPTYAFFTLSHEGIPGHLLQHITLKNSDLPNIRKYLDYTSYSEGWATYVEEYVGKYTTVDQDILNAYFANNRFSYVLMCLADIGVNYKGWSQLQLGLFLEDYYDLDEEALQGLYYQIIEEPTNVLSYYFSYYQLKDIKQEFIEKADDFNFQNVDLEFHKFYLETGPSPFHILKKQIDIYLNNYE